jgi:hypothetical protein
MVARPLAPALCFIATLLVGCIDPPEALQVADAAGAVKARSDLKDPWGGALQHGDQAMSPKTAPAPAALPSDLLRDPFARGGDAAPADAPPSDLRDPFTPSAAGSSDAPAPELRDPFAPKPTPSGAGKKTPPSTSTSTPLAPAPGASMAAAVREPAGDQAAAGDEAEDGLDPEAREKKAREEDKAREEERERARREHELKAAEQAPEPAAR